MTPSKIVIVNDFAHVNGGAGQVALSSAMALAARGHSVTVFSAVAPIMAELKAERIELICTHQHQIRDDPNRLRAVRQGIWNNRAAQRMENLLSGLDPTHTIIHLHGWTKSLSSSIVHTAVKNGFQVVVTMHDYFIACPNGGFYDYKKSQACKLRPLSPACLLANCDKINYPQKLWRVCRQVVQQRWGYIPRGVRHFISISDFSRSVLEPFLPPDAHIYDVPNPVFISKSKPASPAKNNKFVFIGRLDPEKGSELFARAAVKAAVSSLFVGDGACREEIVQASPQAAITGWLAPKQVRTILTRARALVFPSMWYETQGLVVLEAAALGIPAVVPDTSAAREAVLDNVTGLVFRSGDIDDLSRKITLLKDPELASRLGEAAYNRYWSEPNTMELHAQKLEEVYRSVLST